VIATRRHLRQISQDLFDGEIQFNPGIAACFSANHLITLMAFHWQWVYDQKEDYEYRKLWMQTGKGASLF
jgi:hypothetical protein